MYIKNYKSLLYYLIIITLFMSILCYFVNLESFVGIKNRSRQKRNVDKRNVNKRQYKSKKNNKSKSKSKSNSKSKSKSNSIVNINQKQDACENKIANIKVEVETCSSDLTTANQQVETCSSNLTTANQQVETCLTNLQTANEQVNNYSSELLSEKKTAETCSSKLVTANQEAETCSSELATAKKTAETCLNDLNVAKNSSDLQISNLKLKFMNAYNAEIIDSIKLKQLLAVLILIYNNMTTQIDVKTISKEVTAYNTYNTKVKEYATNIIKSITNETNEIFLEELKNALRYSLFYKNPYIDDTTLTNAQNIYNNSREGYDTKDNLIVKINSFIKYI